ncbi:hypothetical protein GL263_25380 [Streptomyces durbertensis]|uniref:Uncharacterized protein n=1 Tax=Streptomyces durbertensis TaxID=2448886 RepID=A0ABR6EP68_9ACTN|nr:hypothetical protein [Streptomyces durbertensis]MBB1246857.1 hypothetical protein [Streptomyces durbertensis]
MRLPSEAELARQALAAPLVSRAATLARWASEGLRVGAGGELLGEQLRSAAEHLGLTGEDGPALAAEAWNCAVDVGLIEVAEDSTAADADDESLPRPDADETVGTATPGPELGTLTGGAPADVLELWQDVLETQLADAAMPSFDELFDRMGLESGADGTEGTPPNLGDLEWDPEAEEEFLDAALANLYLLSAGGDPDAPGSADAPDADGPAHPPVPLPVLAASMVLPDDPDTAGGTPTEEELNEVTAVMMRLDEQFRILEPSGLVDYQPVDDALLGAADEDQPAEDDSLAEDVSRYGVVRLTPLGVHGLRTRMMAAGVAAPAVGDLAEAGAEELLTALLHYPEKAAQEEATRWLGGREMAAAARELLNAARGDDPAAPRRRLLVQQALALVGADAEPALREVLDDGQLGGLARVWLTERGATDVPPPGEEMVFWLTVDTFAAQLLGEDSAGTDELRELVSGLVEQHSGFFDKVWRVEHPATADVLEALGRLHPDRRTAKEARRAAHRARSAG